MGRSGDLGLGFDEGDDFDIVFLKDNVASRRFNGSPSRDPGNVFLVMKSLFKEPTVDGGRTPLHHPLRPSSTVSMSMIVSRLLLEDSPRYRGAGNIYSNKRHKEASKGLI
ncbi:hypothetical protein M6B38_174120 [Iris pallida]|uniref:Uncharacterized protein n=1 Tax=Iris pallida TaxID=29817 RepID=A0AAX6ES47_IRIPA|nr:hypothetical protein M6B38_174120 [Iris pallida]